MKKLALTIAICLYGIFAFAQELDAIMISESLYVSIDESRHSKYTLVCVDYNSDNSDKVNSICLGSNKKAVSVNLLKIGKAIEQAQAECTENNTGISKTVKDDCKDSYSVKVTKANDTYNYTFCFSTDNKKEAHIDFEPESLQKVLDIFE